MLDEMILILYCLLLLC